LYERIESIEKILEERILEIDSREQLLNISDASKFLSLSIATIYTKVCRREIPASKQGKRLYFDKRELIQWIKSGKRKTNQELEKRADDYINRKKG
jgi:predicted DNA-binding transcriptional regulator AlpA